MNRICQINPEDDLLTLKYSAEKRVERTCEWLLKEPSYKTWLNENCPFLWITGLPGQGKSTLALFLVDSLRAHVTTQAQGICTFFFWNMTKGFRNTAVSMLRSVIYQLLLSSPSLHRFILSDYEQQGPSLFSEDSLASLWRILRAMADSYPAGNIYCVLDGLDVCEETSRQLLLRFFYEWVHTPLGDSQTATIKILLLSRPLEGVAEQLQMDIQKHCLHITLGSAGTISDLHRYIESHLKLFEARSWSPARLNRIRQELEKRSGLTFLWAAAALGQARSLPPNYAEKHIQKAPDELFNLYDNILSKVEKEYKDLVVIMVLWINNAARPLTKSELAMALELHKGPNPSRLPSPDELKEFDVVLARCRNLVSVKEDDTVYLLHETLAEHLVKTSQEQNHLAMARVLVRNLSMDDFKDVKIKTVKERYYGPKFTFTRKTVNANPLRQYAYRYWMSHVEQIGGLAANINFSGFFSSSPAMHFRDLEAHVAAYKLDTSKWFRCRVFCDNAVTETQAVHMFILACRQECYPYVEAFLRRNHLKHQQQNVEAIKKEALIQSAELGQAKMTKLLLENSADINATLDHELYEFPLDSRPNITPFYKRTPLHVSILVGHYSLVRILLEAGADVACTDGTGMTGLHIAVDFLRGGIIRLLLEFSADVNGTDHRLQTPLHHAARAGSDRSLGQYGTYGSSEEVTHLLLAFGADPNLKDNNSAGPFRIAIRAGDLDVAKLLIEAGADVDEKDNKGQTALHDAVAADDPELIALLVEQNANLLTADNDGLTPIHVAAKSASDFTALALMESLHDYDTEWFTKDMTGSTPLHIAAEYENYDVLRVFVGFGADVLVVDNEGNTPLHRAVSSRDTYDHSLKTMKYLVDWDDTALVMRDQLGRTPLMAAQAASEREEFILYGKTRYAPSSDDAFTAIDKKPDLICVYLREQSILRHFEYLVLLDPEVQDTVLFSEEPSKERTDAGDVDEQS